MDPRNMTKEVVETKPLPIQDLLQGSMYYPASGTEGQLVKHFSDRFNSFVYCDYDVGEERVREELSGFKGYGIMAGRALHREELIPNGWVPELPPGLRPDAAMPRMGLQHEPFAYWAILQRSPDRGEEHGPERFSLLFVGGDGVASYQALFWTNGAAPEGLAIINPGTGFGNNYTDFRKVGSPLHWMVMNNPHGRPRLVAYSGGVPFAWEGFHHQSTISDYMRDEFRRTDVEVWVAE